MATKLGDIPTVELGREELARYAREADERAQQTEAIPERVTKRPGPDTSPDLEMSIDVEVDAVEFDRVKNGRAPDMGPPLTAVPFVVASREDLSWFELEELTSLVLAKIDGTSSVGIILSALTVPPERSLAALRELQAHGVIEFS